MKDEVKKGSINIKNLLDYWMNIEWWDILEYKDSFAKPSIELTSYEAGKKAIRVFLGCHEAEYAAPSVKGAERQKKILRSYLVSILLYWDKVENESVVPSLSKDHILVNRGVLMYKENCEERPYKTIRSNVANLESNIRDFCEQFFQNKHSLNLQGLSNLLTDCNKQLISEIFGNEPIPREIVKPPMLGVDLFSYRWSFANLQDIPTQYGPYFQADLEMIRDKGYIGGLKEYLNGKATKPVIIVGNAKDENAYETSQIWLKASSIPAGRWPANPEHGLTYLQYIALRAACNAPPLLTVNGPPGTGKTTLLKDLIAEKFVERTIKLIRKLKDNNYNAEKAFGNNKIQEALDYAIIVASANNNAVENISIELPKLDNDIKTYYHELGYFKQLANTHGKNRWGLFCAVLGNKSNRYKFSTNSKEGKGDLHKLCAHLYNIDDPGHLEEIINGIKHERLLQKKDVNGLVYLLERIKECKLDKEFVKEWKISVKNDNTDVIRFIEKENNWHAAFQNLLTLDEAEFNLIEEQITTALRTNKPKKHKTRCESLEKAVINFDELFSQYETMIKKAQFIEGLLIDLEKAEILEEKRLQEFNLAKRTYESCLESVEKVSKEKQEASELYDQEEEYFYELKTNPPYMRWICWFFFLALQLFGISLNEKFKKYALKLEASREQKISALEARRKANLSYQEAEKTFPETQKKFKVALEALNEKRKIREEIQNKLEKLTIELGLDKSKHLFGKAGWDRSEEQIQKATPWGSILFNNIRSNLFKAALIFNQSLVECLAHHCEKNLESWKKLFYKNQRKNEKALDLWSWFFLCFPVMSCTCSSVGIQFATINKPESLGYLLMDEAGQALPYTAAGLLYRCKHAFIVGDPLQIKPICSIPKNLDLSLAIESKYSDNREEMEKYLVTTASVQTLADNTSPIQGKIGDCQVGIPLRVHRRCDSPMFDISNDLSYAGTMVQGKLTKPSLYPDSFHSAWVNVSGEAIKSTYNNSYSNKAEVAAALEIVRRLHDLQCSKEDLRSSDPIFPIYIITQFSLMKQELEKKLNKLNYRKEIVDCGTIHSFQGKEAPTIILCLVCDKDTTKIMYNVDRSIYQINVAVTRAKRRLIVIGDRTAWGKYENIALLMSHLNNHTLDSFGRYNLNNE